MIPLTEKLRLRSESAADRRTKQRSQAVGRAGQVSRSSVSVGDDELLLDSVLVGAVEDGFTVEEYGGDIEFLDDSQAEDVPVLMDVGAAADVEDLIDVAETGPDLGDEFDADADAAEAAHLADMTAIEAVGAVAEAQDAALGAAQKAADALTTANGKNARRRGVTQPAPPEGGWVQGDQWVRDVMVDGVAVPTEVLVWNGTEFVRETLLTGEVLVVGEDGIVRIADGQVTAESIAADALDFKTATGMKLVAADLIGGRISQESEMSTKTLQLRTLENSSRWYSAGEQIFVFSPNYFGFPVPGDVTEDGRTLVIPKVANPQNLRFQLPSWIPDGTPLNFSFWLTSNTGSVSVFDTGGFGQTNPPGQWRKAAFLNRPKSDVWNFNLQNYSGNPTAVGISAVVLTTRTPLQSSVVLDEVGGTPVIGVGIQSPTMPRTNVLEVSPEGMRFRKLNQYADDETTLLSAEALTFTGASVIESHQELLIKGNPLVFEGDTDWANATLPSGVTGTARWRCYRGIVYVQFNLTLSSALAKNDTFSPLFTLPWAAVPEVNSGLDVVGAGTWPAVAWVSAATGACTIRNLRDSSIGVSSFYGSGQWPAPGI